MRKKAEYGHTGEREPGAQASPSSPQAASTGWASSGALRTGWGPARAPGEVGVPGQASLLPSRLSGMRAGHRLWAPRPLPTVGTDKCSNTHA